MQKCVLAARAYNKLAIDGVHLNVADLDGLEASCIQGKNLGFDGKSLIHPNQVQLCNKVYSPSKDEIEYARRVKAAFDEASKAGKGVCVVDGKLVEYLHVLDAKRILDDYAAISGDA